jgi:tetratricopeptide (TPR) repeat protein
LPSRPSPAIYGLNADEVYAGLVAARRAAGTVSTLTVALANLAMADTSLGRWTDAIGNATEGLQLAAETGQQATTGYFLALLAGLAAGQGRTDDCRRLADEALEIATSRRLEVVAAFASWTLATLDLAEGRPVIARRCRALITHGEGAEGHFQAALAVDGIGGQPFELARTELVYGEWLRRARRRADARPHLRTALELYERLGATPWAERVGATPWAERARSELRAKLPATPRP